MNPLTEPAWRAASAPIQPIFRSSIPANQLRKNSCLLARQPSRASGFSPQSKPRIVWDSTAPAWFSRPRTHTLPQSAQLNCRLLTPMPPRPTPERGAFARRTCRTALNSRKGSLRCDAPVFASRWSPIEATSRRKSPRGLRVRGMPGSRSVFRDARFARELAGERLFRHALVWRTGTKDSGCRAARGDLRQVARWAFRPPSWCLERSGRREDRSGRIARSPRWSVPAIAAISRTTGGSRVHLCQRCKNRTSSRRLASENPSACRTQRRNEGSSRLSVDAPTRRFQASHHGRRRPGGSPSLAAWPAPSSRPDPLARTWLWCGSIRPLDSSSTLRLDTTTPSPSAEVYKLPAGARASPPRVRTAEWVSLILGLGPIARWE